MEDQGVSHQIRTVAVVGAGLIGASWASLFLAHDLDIAVTDPAPHAEAFLKRFVTDAWPALVELAGAPSEIPFHRLSFSPDLESTVRDADLIQESGPETIAFKRDIYRRLDALAGPDAIIASSSSGIRMGDIQGACEAHPGRTLIAHPFNPPHLLPLVELVGGLRTSGDVIQRARTFYEGPGKRVVVLNREVIGHVANRLQAALFREVVHLVNEGVVSVADADAAVRFGPGLRWSVMGQCMLYHLGAGDAGLRTFLDTFAPSIEAWWADLGRPALDPPTRAKLIAGVAEEAAGRSLSEWARYRDAMLISRLKADAEHGKDFAGLGVGI